MLCIFLVIGGLQVLIHGGAPLGTQILLSKTCSYHSFAPGMKLHAKQQTVLCVYSLEFNDTSLAILFDVEQTSSA